MIIEIRTQNCFVFKDRTALSLKTDMRSQELAFNVHKEGLIPAAKTAAVCGPNNAGKNCLIRCIRSIREIFLNRESGLTPNLFFGDPVCRLGVTFLLSGRAFSYDIGCSADTVEVIYEFFREITKDSHGGNGEEPWLLKDRVHDKYFCADPELEPLMPIVSSSGLFCHMIDTAGFPKLREMKEIITGFAEKIDIIDMNPIPLHHTVELMTDGSGMQEEIAAFMKNAGLYLDGFSCADPYEIQEIPEGYGREEDNPLFSQDMMEQLRLVSTYEGISVPSMLYDSSGTKKMAAMAGYIVEALKQGRILVVDDLDSGLRFRLVRAIAAMFNNEFNKDAQLIFTAHDAGLTDCGRLFRKEQIWFVERDRNGVKSYSAADLITEDDPGADTDLSEAYRKGVPGAVPGADLINSLLRLRTGTEC